MAAGYSAMREARATPALQPVAETAAPGAPRVIDSG